MTTDDQGQESTDKPENQSQENQEGSNEEAGKEGEEGTEDQSGEAGKEPLTLEKVNELATGLQKGYTMTRQDISKINDNMTQVLEKLNKDSGAKEGDEDYLTVGKAKDIFKEIMAEGANAQNQQKEQNEKYIENTLAELQASGQITVAETDDLVAHAVKIKQPDLHKAVLSYNEVKTAGSAKAKEDVEEKAKKKAQQKEGSGVGNPSGSAGSEEGGVDYAKLKKMQRNGDFY